MPVLENLLIEVAKVWFAWAAFELLNSQGPSDIYLPPGISFCEDHHYGC